MPTPPVVLISFSRPDKTAATLDRIRSAKPSQLFLLCDGPREGREDDAVGTAAVRSVLEDIDWPCEVHRKYWEHNVGVDQNVELGLDWVFDQVDRAVILEDDCFPDLSFFDYADVMLDHFEDDERVAYIGGNSMFVPQRFFDGRSYGFSHYASIWGWATWARAWKQHRAVFPRTWQAGGPEGEVAGVPVRLHPHDASRFVTAGGRAYFQEVMDSRDVRQFNWDSHLWATMGALGTYAATPAVNMVENVGFGADATTTNSTRTMPKAMPAPDPVVHADVALSVEVAREIEGVIVRANGRLARTLRRLIPQGRARTVVRWLGTGPHVVWLMRQLHRLSSIANRKGA
ncbi:hypothetical protein [Nocardioides jiangxiensis]|uniref:Uncharacterized protein n=1 Tax=Nocardioides jiangxiensis TaxID=3064524 RepID=A0ABT9AZ42_9ACTN|nr:hypothetical protein [Nocardioides sp. WY-20]MDO7867859.1 hypothetical protein [Nocardioides sp. WY-20]